MSAQAARYTDYVIAGMVTLGIHVLAFMALVALAVLEIISAPSRVVAMVPPPEVMVEIRPELFLRTPVPPPPVEESPKKMVRTAAHQESDRAPEATNLIGERDTLASSELPPDPNGPAVPSQEGEAPKRPDQLDTIDSSFNDGMEPDVAVTPASEQSPPPGDPLLAPDEVEPEPEERLEEMVAPPPAADPREDIYVTETQVPVPAREEDAEVNENPESLPKETESESEAKESNPAGGAPDAAPPKPNPQDPGFRSEVKKKRLRGSISRRGKSSLDVANTAMGRYQAKLSRAVEREWQRNCLRYREHITPGMLTIRFLLDEKGTVTDVRFLEAMEATSIQKGFTLKSIQSADIPTMPQDVVKELEGDPLELIYNFFF